MRISLSTFRKSVLQLPFRETINFFLYQAKLKTGYMRIITPLKSRNASLSPNNFHLKWLGFLPGQFNDWHGSQHSDAIIREADNVLAGKINAFYGPQIDLDLNPHIARGHWSRKYTSSEKQKIGDIKFIWEPARFGWSMRLGQAFCISEDENFAVCFWEKFGLFRKFNPLNKSPNWESAQEVALRLIAWVVTLHFLRGSKTMTTQNLRQIAIDIADHADRILATLNYARAQNNNHLISEAVGLYTAGTYLYHHERAMRWREIGMREFVRAIERQIDDNGEYTQHSTNYHRMMLMLAVWMSQVSQENDTAIPDPTIMKLRKATMWLLRHLDQESGHVPNLGHNDGSLIFPLSTCDYADYRPSIQAASQTFFRQSLLKPGPYDDLANWLGIMKDLKITGIEATQVNIPRIGNEKTWGIIRAVKFLSRPAHADQLHVDLWYQGHNVLQDAGTYQYNLQPPWNNGLSKSCVHNTIILNRQDQMTRGGRFLWLDWAQAHISHQTENQVTAAHDGYLRSGAVHERSLKKISDEHWQVIDTLYKLKAAKKPFTIDVHWLVPDWPFEISGFQINLKTPFGGMRLIPKFKVEEEQTPKLLIYKAGKPIDPSYSDRPLLGWHSPTYGIKDPAVSVLFTVNRKLPFKISTDIIFR